MEAALLIRFYRWFVYNEPFKKPAPTSPAKPKTEAPAKITPSQSFRRMSYKSLQSYHRLLTGELAKLHDSDDPREQRKINLMRDGLGKQLRLTNAEFERRKNKSSLVGVGVFFSVILWLAGCFLAYHYIGGVALAVWFWLGIVVMIVAAITVQIRDGIERRKRW